jgi:hypothetical protein
MKKLVYLLLIVLCGNTLYAQQESKITAVQAKDFIGKNVLLCDRVKDGHMDNISKDEPTIVYVGDTYETRTLALLFTKDVLKNFSFDPEKKMENHTFCVHGKITMYKGKPAIYVQSEDQLNVED